MFLNLFPRSIVLVMNCSYGRTGGIESLNRNIIIALTELAQAHHLPFRVLSYIEEESARPPSLPPSVPFEPFHWVKRNVFKRELELVPTRPLYIFDHVSLAFPLISFAATGWVQTVIYAHGSEAAHHAKPSSRWSLRFAPLTLVNSNYTLRLMRASRIKANTTICLPGLSAEHSLNETIPAPSNDSIELIAADGKPYPLGTHVLLMVARISLQERGKGHPELIRALPAVRAQFPDVQLVMPGPGADREQLAKLARREGVGSAVFLPGYASTELLDRLYRHCYAFVMPSHFEGFGLVYLEAMNFGKACVGCRNCGASEVIVDGETGRLVNNPTTQVELERVLCDLLSNPERVASMGKAGFARLHQNFTAAQFQKRFQQNIEKLL